MATTKEIVNNVYTYGLRGMERKIRMGVPRTRFLQEHYFGGQGLMTAQRFIKLKIKKRARHAASQAEWNSKGNIIKDDNGFYYKIVEAPYFYDRHVITPDELDQLDFEEDVANPLPYDQKILLVLQNDREDLYDKQETSRELLAFEVLSTGKFALIDGSVQDFGLSASMFVNAATDSAGKLSAASNKAKWLTDKCKAILEDSGVLVDEILLDPDAIWTLLGDTTIQELLDTRRVEGGLVDFQKYKEDGVAYHGTLKLPGFGDVKLLSYAGRYTKDDDTEAYIFPAGSLLFGRANLGDTNHAAVYSNDGQGKLSRKVAAKEFVHVVEGDGDIPSNMAVCLQSSPLYSPKIQGGWMYVYNAL